MKSYTRRSFLLSVSCLLACFGLFLQEPVSAQLPAPPPTKDAARNAANDVRTRIQWLQNATRNAPNYGEQGYGNVWEQFQNVVAGFAAFKHTLTPGQLAESANTLAELDAGLGILQEAFTLFQSEVAYGRAKNVALRDMCQILREGSAIWLDEFNKTSSHMRVG
jgi:hypothetical protein